MKVVLQHLIHFFLHLLFILPVDKKKIYFVSFNGKQYSCNPKYLYEYLLKNRKNEFSYVWEFQDTSKAVLVPNAKVVKRLSFASFIQMMTAGYIVTNWGFKWYIPLRKNQILLETWHGGGAYKKVGAASEPQKNQGGERRINYYVSSSRKFTEVQSLSKACPVERYIPTGMPRNDIILNDHAAVVKVIRRTYGISESDNVLLYAPTYRGKHVFKKGYSKTVEIDFEKLHSALEKKWGGTWKIMYRSHYFDSYLSAVLPGSIIDVTNHEDMQELLCTADVLVTDYSSSMWDFALTKKPCFLYFPDYVEGESEKLFYTPPKTWPFILSTTNDELRNAIISFDESEYVEKVIEHVKMFGSYEKGTACEQVVNIVFADK